MHGKHGKPGRILHGPSGEEGPVTYTVAGRESIEGQWKWLCCKEFRDVGDDRRNKLTEDPLECEATRGELRILSGHLKMPLPLLPQAERLSNDKACVLQRLVD